jgi:carbamate kinase
MRIVAALGGNALLRRGERPDASPQEAHVREAAAALLPLAREHSLVITHGNGPQVGLLAIESGQDPALSRPYPFDVLVAQTQDDRLLAGPGAGQPAARRPGRRV